jgi:hypothetical protein
MRTLAIMVGITLAVGVSAASKAQTPTVWQGDLFLTTVTPQCTPDGINVDNFYVSVYRPNIAPPPPNQADEALTLVSPRSAFLLETTATGKTLRGKVSANGIAISSRATVSSNPSGPTTVALTITPAKITASTPVVQIKGTINNLFNIAGCNVSVVGALGLRP